MKKLLVILLCLPMIGFGQNVNIPDANFKAYLVGNTAINTNGDAEIQVSEATAFNGGINCDNMNISDLIGIEDFTALTYLNCYNNQLTILDVSQNTALISLRCRYNQLTSLDISNNIVLERLSCHGNPFTSLDLRNGNNTNMIANGSYNNFTSNYNLYCIDVDSDTYSTANWNNIDPWATYSNNCQLAISGCNDSTNINYNANAIINDGSCYYPRSYVPNDNFEARLESNQMGDGISGNDSVYTHLIFNKTYLDLSHDSITDLTGIEDFDSLDSLDCSYSHYTNLDSIGQIATLTYLNCRNNNLTSLDVSANLALTYLNCRYNQLTSLDVSANAALTYLNCSSNQFDSLDISANAALTSFDCHSNQLTSLDVNNNTALEFLLCGSNQLTSLDISNNIYLEIFSCGNISSGVGNIMTTLDVSNNLALTEFYCFGNNLDTLDVSANLALTKLWCSGNNLDTLDVSANLALTKLWCLDNQLTSLDVSNNLALTELSCEFNQLTSLDVSNNLALTYLNCRVNNLTSLDVRNGNNANMLLSSSSSNFSLNPQLYCIDVDDASWADTNWTVTNGNIDSTMSFSTNCATAFGCTDSLACNYDSNAIIDDNSCVYPLIWQQAFPICNGDSVIVGTSVYDTTGNFIDTLTSVNGCDSIVFTNLTVFQHTTDSIMQNICDGESFVLGNSAYTTTGNYTDTLNTSNGCDSIVYTNLVVDDNTSSYDTLAIIPNINMYWNNILVNVSGDYDVTFINGNANGCDSTAYLNLTVAITGVLDITNTEKTIVKITDMLGQETPYRRNTPLFYIYDDGTVEKRIVIE
jgi:hypothetical protein